MYSYKDVFTKLKKRLNKSATEDYSNIDYDIATEAMNKAINDWIRRQMHGGNQYKEGAEESRMRVDDLQPLLVPLKKLVLSDGGIFSESEKLPSDYRYFNRFSFFGKNEGCPNKINIMSTLKEEANVDILLNTEGTRPSLKYEQFFHTIIDNKIRLYHNKEYVPSEGFLTYYRNPKKYDAEKPDELCEFKDDVMELLIDEGAKIIAGDTEGVAAYQVIDKSVESNN